MRTQLSFQSSQNVFNNHRRSKPKRAFLYVKHLLSTSGLLTFLWLLVFLVQWPFVPPLFVCFVTLWSKLCQLLFPTCGPLSKIEDGRESDPKTRKKVANTLPSPVHKWWSSAVLSDWRGSTRPVPISSSWSIRTYLHRSSIVRQFQYSEHVHSVVEHRVKGCNPKTPFSLFFLRGRFVKVEAILNWAHKILMQNSVSTQNLASSLKTCPDLDLLLSNIPAYNWPRTLRVALDNCESSLF